jgi:hypothetical protein
MELIGFGPRKSSSIRLAKVKITFGDPIDAATIASNEIDEEVAYQRVTTVLKQRIQQMLDDMRREG